MLVVDLQQVMSCPPPYLEVTSMCGCMMNLQSDVIPSEIVLFSRFKLSSFISTNFLNDSRVKSRKCAGNVVSRRNGKRKDRHSVYKTWLSLAYGDNR